MKNLILSFLFLFSTSFLGATTLNAEEPSLIIIVNTADWCPTCQKHGPRVEEELLSEIMKDPQYLVVINDLTDEATKSKGQTELSALGLGNFNAENNGTGRIYFVDPKSKELIDRVSVSKDSEKIRKKISKALKKIS